MNDLLELLEYSRWANEKIVQAVSGLDVMTYTKDLGSSFPSLRDTLVHIYGADRAWLGRIRGETPARANPQDYPDVKTLWREWDEVLTTWQEVVQDLGDAERVIAYKAFDGTAYSSKLSDIVRHVVNHGTYHRGQITTMLRQLGEKAVSTDLIAYYRLKS
jgi:uncharacterized damage-inducible protein DinB